MKTNLCMGLVGDPVASPYYLSRGCWPHSFCKAVPASEAFHMRGAVPVSVPSLPQLGVVFSCSQWLSSLGPLGQCLGPREPS